MTKLIIKDRYQKLNSRFQTLIEKDPNLAVNEARQMAVDKVIGPLLTEILMAGVLIDAGAEIQDQEAIKEGIRILRQVAAKKPQENALYNLANGLIALTDLQENIGPNWYLETAQLRREARELFIRAAKEGGHVDIRTRALTNLGNAFVKSFRWIEGYDAYQKALKADPGNPIAATGAAKIMALQAKRVEESEANVLTSLSIRFGGIARGQEKRAKELGGSHAVEKLRDFFKSSNTPPDVPDLSGSTAYEKFIALHRLALAPVYEGILRKGKAFDTLRVRSIIKPVKQWKGVPPIFAMFNSIKGDFLCARYIAFQALEGKVLETGTYPDTLDYAVYGVSQSLLIVAQRACFDLLDKTAAAATDYLEILDNPRHVNFSTRWVRENKSGKVEWSEQIKEKKVVDNPGIIALAELSLDVGRKGFLAEKKILRDAGTHRFIVMQDMPSQDRVRSDLIEYRGIDEVKETLIETLQFARAALFYLVDLIEFEEARKRKDGKMTPPIYLPDHHWVRGEDE